ncbi:MAG: hydroxyacid dehydrogenase [Caldisericia bacterium]
MAKILIADAIAKDGIELLKNAGHEVVVESYDADQLKTEISKYDGIIVRSATKVRVPHIEAAKNLKIIGRAGVGLDNIDVKDAEKAGITVVNTPAATSISVAELAIGHMIAAARWIGHGTATMREGKWEKKMMNGSELFGKTVGVIGMGRIGQETAKRLLAFGMKVLAFDPYIKVSPIDGVEMVEKDKLVAESDIITLHIPHTDETHYIIDKPDFDKMKDGVILVNCARGGTVSEDALFEALKSGKVGSAAIDVWEVEPVVGTHKLAEFPNVVMTPHIGASADEGQVRAGIEVAEKFIEFFRG